MAGDLEDVLAGWSLPAGLTAAVGVAILVYARGWLRLRRTRRGQFNAARLASFLAGAASLWIAVGSPLEELADRVLSAHMVEHLILMSVAPPLLLLGLPAVPLLRGLPRRLHPLLTGPLMRLRPLRAIARGLVALPVAWLAMNLTLLAWHVPAAYDLALDHPLCHDAEHLCFLSTSLLFWWTVVRPWPAARLLPHWGVLVYLVGADLVNTALSAFLAFSNRPAYPYYVAHPSPLAPDPLADQVLGAVVMWVFGSFAFLIPAAAITFTLLQPHRMREGAARAVPVR